LLLDIFMLDTLITSKTRVKLLLKFFLNSSSSSYLRALEDEFEESSNAIRVELNRFEDAGLLTSGSQANKKIYQANQQHPLFRDIHNILIKYVGLDHIIEKIIKKVGDIREVYLLGDFARGLNSDIIELLIISDNLNTDNFNGLKEKAEKLIHRKISYKHYNTIVAKQYLSQLPSSDYLLLWQNEG